MVGVRIQQAARAALMSAGLLGLSVTAAFGQPASIPAQAEVQAPASIENASLDRRQNEPGKFDYYVLALSWSPSYCQAAQERAPNRAPDQQCSGRPFSFVVHGLWPQYERGFPARGN